MNRDVSLDTLRGIAILAMVISGTLAFTGDLPVWMYHAQIGVPGYISNASALPITWNDLVFPFFIFSMGAAIPLSLSIRIEQGRSSFQILTGIFIRCLMLLFFGIFLQHVKPFEIRNQPQTKDWLTGIAGFILLFLLYFRYPSSWKPWKLWCVRALVFLAGIGLMISIQYQDGSGFDLYRSDILIILIANNAFFGAIIWYLTRRRPLLRISILPLLFAILVAGDMSGSWNKVVLDATPVPWMYHFDYLGYLFIMIPGTLAGEFILRHHHDFINSVEGNIVEPEDHVNKVLLMVLALVLVALNIVFIHLRYLIFNLLSNVILISIILWIWNGIKNPFKAYYRKYLQLGSYMLLLGIFLEAYQGGIKKEYSTFSYFFLSGGLAIFILMAIIICYDLNLGRKVLVFISMIGKNPMVAYISANLLFFPLYHLLGLSHFPESWASQSWDSWVSGIATAILVAGISIQFTRMNWYLKT